MDDTASPLMIQGARNHGEAVGPVQAIADVDLPLALVEMDLKPVAVVFDFVTPLRDVSF